jgi:phospho-N-acetylmuramoyl-pentapeptide-transferase
MIYHASLLFKSYSSLFNVVHYLSFRIIAALLSALFLFFIFGAWYIRKSQGWFSSHVREYTPESHKAKEGMPTMGGLFIIAVVLITSLLWCNLQLPSVWVFLMSLVGFGVIGFWDDWCKIRYKKGISEKVKFRAQMVVAAAVMIFWVYACAPSTELWFPFFKNLHPDLGVLFIPWGMFLLVATSNAVNLTDGLDGLAIGSLISNFATYTAILYVTGHALFSAYLQIPFAANGEIAIIGAALLGASIGFLWYNTYPAQIFMGDVGSLALGSALALMALMSKQELLLPLTGGLFVLETLSVILQVLSFKIRGKRIFRMAPLHHHFELLGWPEAKITVRFAIISFILCLLGLITLKIR